jgi:transcriptional regulator with XRE-family HTH domain
MAILDRPMASPREFGARLRQLRREKGIRQADLAAATGIPASSLQILECGGYVRMPAPDRIEAIANVLGVRWGELLSSEGGQS